MTISDINLETRALVDADSTSLTAATLLRRVNAAYEEIVGKLIGRDGSWNFDDSNYSNLPIGTQDLVNGQQDYSFNTAFLSIERIEVKDASGIWYELSPIDKSQISGALSEYQKTNGLPVEYDKNGDSIFLYPAPASGSVTLTAGLKVYFQRTASVFLETTPGTPDDATKQPGFASPYHMIICYKAALPFALSYKKDRVGLFLNEINRLEKELLEHYAKREKDVRKQITVSGISFR